MVIFFVEDNTGLLCQTINFFHRNVKDVKILWVQFWVPSCDQQNRSQTVANCFWPNVHLGWSNQILPQKKTLLISPMHLKSSAKATRCEKWGRLMWTRLGLSFRNALEFPALQHIGLSIYLPFPAIDCTHLIFKICQTAAGICMTNQFNEFLSLIFGGIWCDAGLKLSFGISCSSAAYWSFYLSLFSSTIIDKISIGFQFSDVQDGARHSGGDAQWFQMAKNPPKIRSLDAISRIFPGKFQQNPMISVSGHCMHLIFKICRRNKYIRPVNFTIFKI